MSEQRHIPLTVSLNAMRRYRELVANVPAREIVQRLTGPIFDMCDSMGGGAVILPSGHRVVCGDGTIVTVLPKGQHWLGFIGKLEDE